MKTLLVIFVTLLMFGCDTPTEDKIVTDQCLRRELFKECMELLPTGPQETKYNDWSEVVDECQSFSFYASYRKNKHVKDECVLNH